MSCGHLMRNTERLAASLRTVSDLRRTPTNVTVHNALQCIAIHIVNQGAVLLTVGRSYVGNDVTHSTLLDRACACSYENLPTYRSYRVSNTAPCTTTQLRDYCTAVYLCTIVHMYSCTLLYNCTSARLYLSV